MNGLLIIDAQNDFCEVGAPLYVKGADEDMKRLVKWMNERENDFFKRIYCTYDMHARNHVANHTCWVIQGTNRHVEPFSFITRGRKSGTYFNKRQPVECKLIMEADDPELEKHMIDDCIERYGKLQVWPEHCIYEFGKPTHGMSFYEPLLKKLREIPDKYVGIPKGDIVELEEFSAAMRYHDTFYCTLVNKIMEDGITHLFIAGEALSHCVISTICDLLCQFKVAKYNIQLTLLENCSSIVITGQPEVDMDVKRRTNDKINELLMDDMFDIASVG